MAASVQGRAAFELKGRMATLTVLRLLSGDMRHVLAQLDDRLAQAPELFAGMPLVVTPEVPEPIAVADLAYLIAGLRTRGLVPVALTDVPGDTAEALGMGLIRGMEAGRRGAAREEAGRTPAKANTGGTARLVTQPIRSGQQIYARGGDLVVTAAVSAGAELMADGHIHVYGSLRGRALAGVQGDTNARIFCRVLEAELIAVAGQYLLSEQIDAGLRGSPVMAWLDDDVLRLAAI